MTYTNIETNKPMSKWEQRKLKKQLKNKSLDVVINTSDDIKEPMLNWWKKYTYTWNMCVIQVK